MEYLNNPLLLTLLVSGGIFAVSFMLGKSAGQGNRDEVIENTILYLINERYVKARKDIKGEWELIKLDQEVE